jgi:AcrR family transcriptional regulator
MQDKIIASARRQLVQEGSDAVSLRAIAREMGMASSAIHRYFPTRDALLEALRQRDASSIATAMDTSDRSIEDRSDYGGRVYAALLTLRGWALANPNCWMLLSAGKPMSADDISGSLGARFLSYVIRPLGEARAAHVTVVPPRSAMVVESEVIAAVDGVTDVVPRWQLTTAVAAYAWACGAIGVELQGQLSGLVSDPEGLFRAGAEHWVSALGL